MVVCQATWMLNVPPSSLASQLLQLFVVYPGPVGASLLAMAVCQATWMLNVPPSSLASQLLQLFVVYPGPCRSELARDGGLSGNINV